jgi:hypothetical protein
LFLQVAIENLVGIMPVFVLPVLCKIPFDVCAVCLMFRLLFHLHPVCICPVFAELLFTEIIPILIRPLLVFSLPRPWCVCFSMFVVFDFVCF